MIRYEVTTIHKSFVGCEDTQAEAEEYIKSLFDAGVEILNVRYYDKDQRVSEIRKVGTLFWRFPYTNKGEA